MFHQVDLAEGEETTPFNPVNIPGAAVVTVFRGRDEACEEKSMICTLHALSSFSTLQPSAKSVEVDERHEQGRGLGVGLRSGKLNESG